MKKLFKSFLCFAIAFIALFNFTACKTPISETTTDSTKTVNNGVNTNGGMTLVYNDGTNRYLYFINGTKTNDGTSLTKNTRSAICRVKLGDDDKIVEDTYEVVIDSLVGFDNGSLNIFGNFLYYATPSDDVNFKNSKLNYQTKFMRYDLVNKKSYEIYTTKKNTSEEKISYAYYVVGNDLNLVVYETKNETITSLKVGEKTVENYVISGVKSCIFSENNGKSVGTGVDANNFVYYTTTYETYEYPQTGNYVYMVSPNTNNSYQMSKNGKTVSLLSIKNGKLIYSANSTSGDDNIIYFENISSEKSNLTFSETNKISHTKYTNVIFMENSNSIDLLAYNDTSKEITVYRKSSGTTQEIDGEIVNTLELDSNSDLSFIGTVTLDEKTEDKTEKVTYLIYTVSNYIYKIEVMRDGAVSENKDPIKLSKSTISAPSGCLVPEIIGNYLYALAKENEEESSSNIYLFRFDLTISKDSSDNGTMVGISEK